MFCVQSPGQPVAGSPWYFYYSLLGNDITSEPFHSDTFRPERASVRVKTTRELLGTLLSAQEDVQVCVCVSVCICACVCACICICGYMHMCSCVCVVLASNKQKLKQSPALCAN